MGWLGLEIWRFFTHSHSLSHNEPRKTLLDLPSHLLLPFIFILCFLQISQHWSFSNTTNFSLGTHCLLYYYYVFLPSARSPPCFRRVTCQVVRCACTVWGCLPRKWIVGFLAPPRPPRACRGFWFGVGPVVNKKYGGGCRPGWAGRFFRFFCLGTFKMT